MWEAGNPAEEEDTAEHTGSFIELVACGGSVPWSVRVGVRARGPEGGEAGRGPEGLEARAWSPGDVQSSCWGGGEALGSDTPILGKARFTPP